MQLPLAIMSRYPWELSAGQRQRVAIARSLILQPMLWVADEPTSSVDVATRGPVLDTLLELHAERVFSAVIISHDAAVMHRTTHRVVVMQRGILIASGTADEIFADPAHPYVRGLRDDYFLRTGAIGLPQQRSTEPAKRPGRADQGDRRPLIDLCPGGTVSMLSSIDATSVDLKVVGVHTPISTQSPRWSGQVFFPTAASVRLADVSALRAQLATLRRVLVDTIGARSADIALAKLCGFGRGALIRFGLGEPIVLLLAAVLVEGGRVHPGEHRSSSVRAAFRAAFLAADAARIAARTRRRHPPRGASTSEGVALVGYTRQAAVARHRSFLDSSIGRAAGC